MHTFPSQISSKLKNKLKNEYPDLLLYIDNPYIEDLINALIDILSEEITDLKNNCITKGDLKMR